MAAKTFSETTATGGLYLWSTADNWGGAVPVDNDSVTIPVGKTITYDGDMSDGGTWPNGLSGLAINGVWNVITTASSYLKVKANITGSGTYNCGSSGTAFPAAYQHTVYRNGSYDFRMTGTVSLYCVEPTHKYCKIAGATEAAGQTVLSVDTDLTGAGDSTWWANGSEVRICRASQNGWDPELRTIDTVSSTTITISAGLTAQKEVGSVIVLLKRNILITGSSAGSGAFNGAYGATTSWFLRASINGNINQPTAGTTIDGVLWSTQTGNGVYAASGLTIPAAITAVSRGLNACTYCIFTGVIAGCDSGIYAGTGNVLSGLVSGCSYGVHSENQTRVATTGVVDGCLNGLHSSANPCQLEGTVNNCQSGLNGVVVTVAGGTISNCGAGVKRCPSPTLYGATFSGNSADYEDHESYTYARNLGRSFRTNGTDHDDRGWAVRSGSVSPMTTTFDSVFFDDSGKTHEYVFTYGNASYYHFMEWDLECGPIETMATVEVECYAKHDATGLAASARLTFEIIDPKADPWVNSANSALDTWTAADSTDIQMHTLSYARTDPRPLKVRIYAKRASGTHKALLDFPLEFATAQPVVIPDGDTVTMKIRAQTV